MNYLVSLQIQGNNNQNIRLGETHSILWDTRDLIYASSGLAVFNQQDIGPAKAMIPILEKGILELSQNTSSYARYDILFGLGTVKDVLEFYRGLLSDCMAHPYMELYGCILT